MSVFTPTLRERWRWWRWAFSSRGGPAQFSLSLPFPDKATRNLVYARHQAKEPWPRPRYDWRERKRIWSYTTAQEAEMDDRLKKYGPPPDEGP